MPDGGLQNGDGGALLTGGALRRRQLAAQGLRRDVVLLGLLREFLIEGVHVVQRLLRPVAFLLGQCRVGLQFQLGGADILQLLQPYRNFENAQLVTEDEVLLRRLRLLAQRLDL